MFKTIVIIILLCIILYLILDKKNVKAADIKDFFKKLGTAIKEKAEILFDKIKQGREKLEQTHKENKLRKEAERREQEAQKQQDAQKQQEAQKQEAAKEEPVYENFQETIKMNKTQTEQTSQEQPVHTETRTIEKVKVVRSGGCLSSLLSLIIIILLGLFIFKKVMIDYDGTYATDRLTYTEEYGICLLITYYPEYQVGEAKGYAITNIPFFSLFNESLWAQKNYGTDPADSEEDLNYYRLVAAVGDNAWVDTISKSLTNTSTRSINIGNHGKYILIRAKQLDIEDPLEDYYNY